MTAKRDAGGAVARRVFDDEQIRALNAKLDPKHIKERPQAGRKLSYIEAWRALAEANAVFGFDGWDRETIENVCVWQGEVEKIDRRTGEVGKQYAASYRAKVRITVYGSDGSAKVVREGTGYGDGYGDNPGQAHELACKESETDGTKRALSTFGWRFGLALYDKVQEHVGVDYGWTPSAIDEFEGAVKTALAAVADLDGLDRLYRDELKGPLAEIKASDPKAMQRIVGLCSERKVELQAAQKEEVPV